MKLKVKPINEIIGSHRDNVKVDLDAVQSKLRPLNQSIATSHSVEFSVPLLLLLRGGSECILEDGRKIRVEGLTWYCVVAV